MSTKYTRDTDPHALPVMNPTTAEVMREWARLNLAIARARDLAAKLEDALGELELPEGKLHPTTPFTQDALSNEASHAAWLLDILHHQFNDPAPMIVSALTGCYSPEADEGDDDPDRTAFTLDMLLAELGATAEDREEFDLPEA